MQMTHLSLFSGIGGIDISAHRCGFETVAFCERDPFCQRVLNKNFPGVPVYDDVCTISDSRLRADGVPQPTLVSAGFPCQPHSLAGMRKASGDERDLWGETARIVRETSPRWFLGENVFGLLSSENGRFFGRVLDDLASMGMSVGWGSYGAGHVGARHRRLRVFLVAYANCVRSPGVLTDELQPKPWECDPSYGSLLDRARLTRSTPKLIGNSGRKQIDPFPDLDRESHVRSRYMEEPSVKLVPGENTGDYSSLSEPDLRTLAAYGNDDALREVRRRLKGRYDSRPVDPFSPTGERY